MKSILVFFAIIFIALAYGEKVKYLETPVDSPSQKIVYAQQQLWFDQIIDHYDYSKSKVFSQRYYVIDNFFNPKVGPVFLFICGEYTCSGVPEARQWVITMAERLQGLILTLEHRFYGRSLPFGYDSYTVENMRLLNSEQALKDLAYFTEQVVSQKLHKVDKNPWISIGGSYPGAVSAWYRYKYPHLTIGAIASSAVINAIVDFKEFDEQMFLSANKSGDYCYKAINDSSTKVESILNGAGGADFKAQFEGGDKLTDNEFLFFWIDSIVEKIQYGSRTTLCDSLKGKSADDQLKIFIELAKANDVHGYGGYYLKNATYYA
jgi:hypothetical protein